MELGRGRGGMDPIIKFLMDPLRGGAGQDPGRWPAVFMRCPGGLVANSLGPRPVALVVRWWFGAV